MNPDNASWPDYVCAILENSQGRLLLESRPETARFAAGLLTCFGGRREVGETPDHCLLRELREELNWEPQSFHKQMELWVGGLLIAWFYHATLSVPIDRLQLLPNHQAVLVEKRELSAVPLSPWHAATLRVWLEGGTTVILDA